MRSAKRQRTQGAPRSAARQASGWQSLDGSLVLRVSGASGEGAILGALDGVQDLRESSGTSEAQAFRFDAVEHAYYYRESRIPSITQMLNSCGLIDSRWYTEESCERGTLVHSLTADYDLGALTDLAGCTSRYKAYLLGHVKALAILQPEILEVELPRVHPIGFGGRPDRVVRYRGLGGVLEIKSGGVEKVHGVQTALQAILVAPVLHLPAEALVRLCLYLKPSGRFRVEEHVSQTDFTEARRVIAECCRA